MAAVPRRPLVGIFAAAALILAGVSPARAEPSVFAEPEPLVERSPDAAASTPLPAGTTLRTLAVSPVGPDVAVLLDRPDGSQSLLHWRIGQATRAVDLPGPAGRLDSLAWHPHGGVLFAAGLAGLFRIVEKPGSVAAEPLWQGDGPLAHLVAGPRPFLVQPDGPAKWTPQPAAQFRLFFAERRQDGTNAIGSVDEQGRGHYLVTAAAPPPVPPDLADMSPKTEALADMVPLAFHPAGDALVIADSQGCFRRKPYQGDNWGAAAKAAEPCGGAVAYAPNGAALIHWQDGRPGLAMLDAATGRRTTILQESAFAGQPGLTPDGRGVIGVVRASGGALELRYLPLTLPLADVANAWMFLETPQDQALFAANGGLFRPVEAGSTQEQLYRLYDTESYYCGGYDPRQSARPYLVTTDIFWEIFGAAYEGLFMAVERDRAVPALRSLVDSAARELASTSPGSRLAGAFAAADALMRDRPEANPEAARIAQARDSGRSDVLQEEIDYRVFAPRGHYTKDPTSRNYFRAVRYLSAVALDDREAALVAGLSAGTRALAANWIASYRPFIAAPRARLAWDPKMPLAAYIRKPEPKARLFPLSWGWDNELLDTGMHDDAGQPITGPAGPRPLPSGLDLAMALGNPTAHSVLAGLGVFRAYPIEARLLAAGKRFAGGAAAEGDDLYDRWIRALATQWAEDAEGPIAGPLWDAKRLQTGLASWATLRHATVLVNDRVAAECGEAGFEDIRMLPPRGYVEPDPASFAAIADLFQEAAAQIRRLWPAGDPLAEGLVRRLAESRDDARRFGAMAAREVAGQALAPADYEAILAIAGVAEHNYLVFFSLQSEGNALANPDPVAKIAEVAGRPETGWLEAAVGVPLEWDQIVPGAGLRRIVKGAVYAYHEFTSDHPMTDPEWRHRAPTASHPDWVARFVSGRVLACPPKEP